MRWGRRTTKDPVNPSARMIARADRHLARGERQPALVLLEQAAQLGDTHAAERLGIALWDEREFDAALPWLRLAAEDGSRDAVLGLGIILLDHRGEPDEAQRWLERAARSGSAIAMSRYALLLHEQGDVADALEWGRKAHAAGEPVIGALLPEVAREQSPPPAAPESPSGDATHEPEG